MTKLTKIIKRELNFHADFRPAGGRKVCMAILPAGDGDCERIRFWSKGLQHGCELPLRTVFELAVKAAADEERNRKADERRGRQVARKVKRFGMLGK